MPLLSIGFTGTRHGMTPPQLDAIRFWLNQLDPTEAHHGDCIGADAQFAAIFDDLYPNCTLHAHPSDLAGMVAYTRADVRHPPIPPINRNHLIVDHATRLLAAPDGPERRHSGTWATIRYAAKKGCPVVVVEPSGQTVKW